MRSGGTGSPSGSEIIISANAEVENDGGDLITFSGGFASGVAGAHGRVYDNSTFILAYGSPGGQEEFVSGGCRFYFRTDATDSMLRFRRVSAAVNHIAVQRAAGGTFRVANLATGVNHDSGSANISLITWYYCILYARIHDTLGEFIAKLFDASGTLIETLTQTGIDTLNGGNKAEISAWGGVSGDTYVDHLWTDINGVWRSPVFVETRSPTANGDTNSWTRGGTDTGNNWDQADELPKNTTSYVFSTGADQVELYNFQDRSQAGTPLAVHQVIYAHAHTAGTREYKPICKIGGVIYEGPTQSTTSTSTLTAPIIYNWQNDPSTGNAWTDSGYNAAQFGVKSVTTDVRVQCMALQIPVGL